MIGLNRMNNTIGFIGLGLLGSAMARRLQGKGYAVTGYDIDPARVEAMADSGVTCVDSPAQVIAGNPLVLLCVTHSDAVRDVIHGADGLLSTGSLAGKVIVDHSTTDVSLTRDLAAQLDAAGASFIDAPVSGGPAAATAGTLSIMAGGSDSAIETVRAAIEQLGRFTRMGDAGAGQATKLVNQALVLPAYCMMAEAMRLAQAFNVDVSKVPHALQTGYAGSNLLPVLFERMRTEDFTPTGFARQVLKDLEMLHKASAEHHVAMPMTDQALNLFRLLVSQGKGELDGAAVVSLWPKPSS